MSHLSINDDRIKMMLDVLLRNLLERVDLQRFFRLASFGSALLIMEVLIYKGFLASIRLALLY